MCLNNSSSFPPTTKSPVSPNTVDLWSLGKLCKLPKRGSGHKNIFRHNWSPETWLVATILVLFVGLKAPFGPTKSLLQPLPPQVEFSHWILAVPMTRLDRDSEGLVRREARGHVPGVQSLVTQSLFLTTLALRSSANDSSLRSATRRARFWSRIRNSWRCFTVTSIPVQQSALDVHVTKTIRLRYSLLRLVVVWRSECNL